MTTQTCTTNHSTPTPRASAQPTINRILKMLALCAVALGVLSMPAMASTPIYSCQTITSGGDYYVNNGLSTASATCLEVSGVSGSNVNIDCNGYSITAADRPIYIHGNSTSVWYHDCSNGIYSTNATGTVLIESCGSTTYSDHNIYNLKGGSVTSRCTYVSSSHDTYVNASFDIQPGADNNTVYSGTFSSTGNGTYPDYSFAGFVTVQDSSYASITYNTGSGHVCTTCSPNTANSVDDGTVIFCTSGHTCAYNDISYNNWGTNYDAGVEFAGQGTHDHNTVDHNTLDGAGAGVACYGAYFYCNITNSSVTNNSIVLNEAYPSAPRTLPFYFDGHNGAGVFTGNTFSSNTVDTSKYSTAYGSYFGNSSPSDFGTISSNTITGNHFGGDAWFFSLTGFTDGGGNYCTNTATPITCH